MHKTSGRWKYGLFLALITSLLWGVLPIALVGLLKHLDSSTITWFRFVFALVLLLSYLIYAKKLPPKKTLNNKFLLLLLAIATIGLLSNYILYMYGLEYSTPESAQLMIQVAPMLLLVGSLIIFKESFSIWQGFGFIAFVVGLILFFNHRFEELLAFENTYSLGIFLIFIAAILWAVYALLQKQLLKYLSSEQIMMIIFACGAIVFLPISSPLALLELDQLGWCLLLFCGANTLIAYGAFAESLEHWEASRVSATLAITSLITLFFMMLTSYYFPDYIQTENINNLSIFGAILVVAGSAVVALVKTNKSSASELGLSESETN
ncbi:MAG: DMT family transporter [Paraglaciecola sp.]|nr:DMT family transporter [Paraglaciecola sp.]